MPQADEFIMDDKLPCWLLLGIRWGNDEEYCISLLFRAIKLDEDEDEDEEGSRIWRRNTEISSGSGSGSVKEKLALW